MIRFDKIGFELGLVLNFGLMGKDLNGNGLWVRKKEKDINNNNNNNKY